MSVSAVVVGVVVSVSARSSNAYTNRVYYIVCLILTNVYTISICLYTTQAAVDLTQHSDPGSNGTLKKTKSSGENMSLVSFRKTNNYIYSLHMLMYILYPTLMTTGVHLLLGAG